jgi:hypothetical protein
MKPIQGSNNNVHNKDINNAELTNSEIVLFDERSDHPINHNRIKPTSPLESFKAFVQQAINAIRAAFNFKTHHQIPTSNIKADIIPKAETPKNGINNQLIANEVNVISSPLNNTEANLNDPLLDDFEIIESLDDFNMKDDIKIEDEIKNKEENILVETTSLIDERADEIQTENYGAFANWYKSGANIKVIPDDAIGYAKYLIRTHFDFEKIKDIPELLAMVEAAKNLVQEVERKEPSFFELGLDMQVNTKKEMKSNALFGVVVSERHDKDLLKKYLNEESQRFIQLFYPNNIGIQNQSEIDQIKNDTKTFLFWKTLWSPIFTKSDLTVQNYESRLMKTPTEEEKDLVANVFKAGEFKIFNDHYLASDNDLHACKRFIEKYEQVKKIGSENQKEELDLLNLDKYIKDFKNFYLDVQIVKIQEKKEENLKIERHVQDISTILPEIIIFQSLNAEAIQALHTILAPELPMPSFQKIISEAKSYFSSIGNNLIIKDEDRAAALVIAGWWPKLNVNAKPITTKSEASNFFGQFDQFFTKDPLPELKAIPNFDKLNALLNVEKISNDFK